MQVDQSQRLAHLHVEYAEPGEEYGILFIFSLFCEYIQLEYVRIHVIYRVNQAGYGIHIRVVAPLEYVNIYSTRRHRTRFQRRAHHGRGIGFCDCADGH